MTGEVEVEVFIAHMTGVKLLWGVHKIVEGIEKKGGGEGGEDGGEVEGDAGSGFGGAREACEGEDGASFLPSFVPSYLSVALALI